MVGKKNTHFIKKKKKTIGLLILFVHSKHCKSSRGPEVVVCVSVCVWLCGCFVSAAGRESRPFLLSVGYVPVRWTALHRRPVDLNIAPTWHLLLSKGKEKLHLKENILPSARACQMTSDKLIWKVNLPFSEAYHTFFSLKGWLKKVSSLLYSSAPWVNSLKVP